MSNLPSQNALPGFRVRETDDVPGFDIGEDGLPRRQRTWFPGMLPTSATPQVPDSAPAPTVTPGPGDLVQPALPQPPDWLYNLLTMKLPALPSPFAPLSGGAPAPYGPPINPAMSSPTTGQNMREMAAERADVPRITPPPALGAVEAPGTEQWPSFDAPSPLADIDAQQAAAPQNANPQPAGQEATGDAWPPPPEDGQPYPQAGIAGPPDSSGDEIAQQAAGGSPTLSVGIDADPNFVLANAGDDDVQQAQQQKPPPPQNQQTQQKRPPAPSGIGLGKTPPAPRVPEKPGMEMTELERRREQEFADLNRKWWRLKEADRRQPIWDQLTRKPPKQTTSDNEFPDLLPDNWEEFLTNKIDRRYAAWTRAAAERHNIPPALLARLLYQESKYKAKAVSPNRAATGIAQLTPIAVKALGLDPRTFSYDDPKSSIDAGAAYLAQQYRSFKNWPKAVVAYNAGGPRLVGWLQGDGRDWSTVPEKQQDGWWREMNAHLQAVFRGQPEQFDN